MDKRAITGCLLGTAVGDALGLPCEGLSPRRAARLFRDQSRYHFLGPKGMVSDDTELMCITAQALIAAGGNPGAFTRETARRLRWWLLGLPVGIGWATLKAAIKLTIGFGPGKSGVYSAGNAPAARSAIIGLCYAKDEEKMKDLVKRTTTISHTDPKAWYGALAVALAAHCSATDNSIDGNTFCAKLERLLADHEAEEFLQLIRSAASSAGKKEDTSSFAASQGLHDGVSGYVYHTVPVAIQAWLRYPDNFEKALLNIIACGGDTDTTGAIVGAIVGSGTGKEGIPGQWLDNLMEWPRTVTWIESLAQRLSESVNGSPATAPPRLPALAVITRNMIFALIVLLHGFRRMLPPY